ncbi:MAG: hypothetical protein J5673_02745 [Candidatus Methanomethylophilaceae archaeon]|nr:hypothetical protein [Candidatus Methanomethylophilaceae archaeon]
MLFNKKVVLVEHQELTVGEFNININGAYDNVKTFPLEVKKGRKLFVSVKSDNGVDVSIVDVKGMNESFSEAVKDKLIGPVAIEDKGTMALILGVYRGDLAHVELEAWME